MKKMTDVQIIDDLISSDQIEEAIALLNKYIDAEPQCAHWLCTRGQLYWRLGKRGKAISDFEKAVNIDVNSPASISLAMARSIMDFRDPTQLNP